MKRFLFVGGWIFAVLFLLVGREMVRDMDHPLFEAWVAILAVTLLSTVVVRLIVSRWRAG